MHSRGRSPVFSALLKGGGGGVLHVPRPDLCGDDVGTRVPELVGRQIEERRGEGVSEVAPEGRPQLDHRGEYQLLGPDGVLVLYW